MKRLGASLASVLAWGLVAGCFSDPSGEETCSPGMEGCACVELQCEQGLMCMGGVCVAGGGSTGEDTATTLTSDPSTATSTSTTTGEPETSSTTGEPMTTTAADSSSSGEPASESSATSSSDDVCGDFVIGPTEECDGGNGCSDACELEEHECNPLNNVPCPSDYKCSWELLMPEPFTGYFTCLQLDDAPLADGEGECFAGGEAQDELCALGLACFSADFLENCTSEGCCTEYCDVNEGACSNPAFTCVAEPNLAPGLAFLGVCRPG